MPTVDFGSVTLVVDEGRVDAFFPREHDEVKAVMKGLRAQWNQDRRCWIAVTRFAKKSEEEIVAVIEKAIGENVPRKWPATVEKFGNFACASKKYEIKFGAAGLRLMLPDGHPCHYKLEKLQGASRERRGITWTIPARHATPSVIIPILERAAREDRKIFIDAVEPYGGRTLRGTVPVSPEEADRIGLAAGRVVFAEYSFVKAADPQVVNMPVHAWAFKVVSRKDEPGEGWDHLGAGVDVKLQYLEADHAFRAVRKLMSMPEEERPPRLDAPHAADKWKARLS